MAALDAVFTNISRHIVDDGIVAKNKSVLINSLIVYGSLILVQAGSVFLFIYLAGILGERIRYDLRKMMFNHLQALSLNYYSKTPVGWIMARVTSDSERVADLVTWGLVDVTWGLMSIVISLGFMFFIKWQLALIVLGLLPILLFVAYQFRKRIIGEYRNVRKFNSKIVGAYNENITGVRVIKALGREKENLDEFKGLTGSMYQSAFPRCLVKCIIPAIRPDHIRFRSRRGGLVWRFTSQHWRNEHRQYSGVCLLHYLHDVASPGYCPCFC